MPTPLARYIVAPGGWGGEKHKIEAYDGHSVTYTYSDGRHFTERSPGKFLGCRDGYAFFQNQVKDLFNRAITMKATPHESLGHIVSLDRGIMETDQGHEIPAEKFNVWSYPEGRIILDDIPQV